VLARALYVQSLAIAGSAPLARRVAVAEELLAVTADATDLVNRGYGLLVRIPLHLAVGEVPEYERRLAELAALAEATRDWYLLAATAQHRAARALLLGDFAGAAGLAAEMLSHSSEQDFISVYTTLSFFSHWAQGRLEQILPLVEAGFAATPTIAYRAALALALAELGRTEEAAAHVEAMAADGFSGVPRNSVWPATMATLGDVVWILGDGATAGALLGQLEDRAGELIVIAAHAAAYYSASDRILGVLAATTGDLTRATAHFEAALVLERRVAAKPLECRTRFCYGKVLALAGADGAGEMLTTGAALADELGMVKVAADARALLG
jgi:tetratricopeptide (TPR) repeat protein